MLSIKPELQRLNPLPLFQSDVRHLNVDGAVGFSGGPDYGGILSDVTPAGQGAAMTDLGIKTGADSVLRAGSLGAQGINRHDDADFAGAMLNAIDKVSAMNHRASDLTQAAIVDPSSVDAHDISIAQAEASMSLNIARTILNRLTQSWRDLINVR